MNLVFLGPPGAGKGTQAKRLAGVLGIPHISTGDILRQAVREGGALGREARGFMERGELVPDDVVVGIVAERVRRDDCGKGYILDGFPRTVEQASRLEAQLGSAGSGLDHVVFFQASREVIIDRLGGRVSCENPACGAIYHIRHNPPRSDRICDRCAGRLVHRADDEEDAIRRRLEVYEAETAPVVDFYRERGLLREIRGDGDADAVFRELESLVR